ncbi:ankyrin repeat protein, partial [Glonium stellatum]
MNNCGAILPRNALGRKLLSTVRRTYTLGVKLLLLEAGNSVNFENGSHDTPIHVAVERGHIEIIQLLLNKGADINAQGGVYGTALQAASKHGHNEIVQLLLSKGAD